VRTTAVRILPHNGLLTFPKGTTYSCVANYEGTNVEISMRPPA
jgi:hypothetical protein